MSWNWQKPDWPNFRWDTSCLTAAEKQFLLGAGVGLGTAKHLGAEERNQLIVEAMSGEALTTSEIEGEILNRASVQSSIQRQLGLTADQRRIPAAEQGIAEMMVDLYRSTAEPVSDVMLFRWHQMLTLGRRDLIDIGRFRTSAEPMQVVSGAMGAEKVHFEAPPSILVPAEMSRFIIWFNRTGPQGEEPLPAITRASIAHLYFESIHPFEDGNGRIGRALAEKVLAQSFDQPAMTGLATAILAHQKSYYEILERANKGNEITDWLAWFADIAIEAQHRIITQVEFLIAKTKLLDRLRDKINMRQQKALLRMMKEGPEGFKGGLSAGNYATITGATPATTTRDLTDLVEKGALIRTGERKHARYALKLTP
ncbi:MAG TPA: Fic family protein [Terracidiphilus sp.]|jgi:Fic family protein